MCPIAYTIPCKRMKRSMKLTNKMREICKIFSANKKDKGLYVKMLKFGKATRLIFA